MALCCLEQAENARKEASRKGEDTFKRTGFLKGKKSKARLPLPYLQVINDRAAAVQVERGLCLRRSRLLLQIEHKVTVTFDKIFELRNPASSCSAAGEVIELA
jgi:hypothetical protein